ncbi:recombinase family protein [Coleofasciculus sp. D1-CHI-01]|uniref:recombinase family protein n=1 Tax=Coleofasciculus sp. D1-CHI-01 TaxID=3068482 RepID=UPI0040642530
MDAFIHRSLNSQMFRYVRVSSHDQKSKGDLDRQKTRILEYCVNRKYNVDHILVEVVKNIWEEVGR